MWLWSSLSRWVLLGIVRWWRRPSSLAQWLLRLCLIQDRSPESPLRYRLPVLQGAELRLWLFQQLSLFQLLSLFRRLSLFLRLSLFWRL